MAKRSLEELQKRYSSASSVAGKSKGPGGPGGPRGPRGARPTGKPKNSKATVRRLISYIAVYRMRILVVLVFMLLNTLCSVAGSYLLRDVINVVYLSVSPE